MSNVDTLLTKERMVRDWKFAACNTKARLHHSSKRRSISVSGQRGRRSCEEARRRLETANRVLREGGGEAERALTPDTTDSDKMGVVAGAR